MGNFNKNRKKGESIETQNLKSIQDNLLSLKDKLSRSLKLVTKDKTKFNGELTQDIDDQSISLQNDEVIDELDRLERAELIQIDYALKRIQNGNYGKCISCGERIAEKRLRALPYTSMCIACTDEQD